MQRIKKIAIKKIRITLGIKNQIKLNAERDKIEKNKLQEA
jgi:hypothetical protein